MWPVRDWILGKQRDPSDYQVKTWFGTWRTYKYEGEMFDFPWWIRFPQAVQRFIYERSYCTDTVTLLGWRWTREGLESVKYAWQARPRWRWKI
jgi:hypothetical protein